MPLYEFECNGCQKEYDDFAPYDKDGLYPEVKCPDCGSSDKRKLVSRCGYAFANPIGTDRWMSDKSGHDYRYKHNIPNVIAERERAASKSHVGSNPYSDALYEKDLSLGEGIHSPEERPGLS